MYVAHRFPASALWWPTLGEDIQVEDFGTVPGKAFYLEVKTPEQHPTNHVITIDLAQLTRYRSQPIPVFYVFPQPPWAGEMLSSGWLGPERRADLAYRRTNHRWFGKWTIVVSADALWAHLAAVPGQATAQVLGTPPHWLWPDFWSEMATCGSPNLQAMFVLPERLADPSRDEMRAVLADFSETLLENRSIERWFRREYTLDLPRYYYVPTQFEADSYREISAAELLERRITFDSLTATAVCSLPFEALRFEVW